MVTLGYARRLRDAGIPAPQAEAHAEAAREFIVAALVTKADLEITRQVMESWMTNHDLRSEKRMQGFENRLNNLELRLTVRLGGMVAIAVAILAAVIKF